MNGLSGSFAQKQIVGSDPQLQGTWPDKNLRQLCAEYHGVKGDFAYAAYSWLNETVFDGRIPTTLIQWALTPYGGCIGLTSAHVERPPVVTLHPAIWQPHGHGKGWSQCIPAGPRYTLDVVLHELIHVEVSYLMGGHGGKSSHDCVEWCESIMRAASRLKGTILELPPFKAAPTMRVRENGKQCRRTPAGCISMKDCSMWPHSLRMPPYYGSRYVPWS